MRVLKSMHGKTTLMTERDYARKQILNPDSRLELFPVNLATNPCLDSWHYFMKDFIKEKIQHEVGTEEKKVKAEAS